METIPLSMILALEVSRNSTGLSPKLGEKRSLRRLYNSDCRAGSTESALGIIVGT